MCFCKIVDLFYYVNMFLFISCFIFICGLLLFIFFHQMLITTVTNFKNFIYMYLNNSFYDSYIVETVKTLIKEICMTRFTMCVFIVQVKTDTCIFFVQTSQLYVIFIYFIEIFSNFCFI